MEIHFWFVYVCIIRCVLPPLFNIDSARYKWIIYCRHANKLHYNKQQAKEHVTILYDYYDYYYYYILLLLEYMRMIITIQLNCFLRE